MNRSSYAQADRIFRRGDIVVALAVAAGLALPYLLLPGDSATRMAVRFHAPGMAAERSFAATTTRSACAILAAALEYEDHATGNFTHVTCK